MRQYKQIDFILRKLDIESSKSVPVGQTSSTRTYACDCKLTTHGVCGQAQSMRAQLERLHWAEMCPLHSADCAAEPDEETIQETKL